MSERLKPLVEALRLKTEGKATLGWWVLPSRKKPRLVVPIESRYWKSATQLINTKSRRIATHAILSLFKLMRKSPDFMADTVPSNLLSTALEAEVSNFVVNVSTPNRFSKYTISLLDKKGEPIAYAKLTEKPTAALAIEDEATALKFLATTSLPKQYFPRLIHFEPDLSIQSAAPPGGHGDLAAKCGNIANLLFNQAPQTVQWESSKTRSELIQASENLKDLNALDLSAEVSKFTSRLETLWGSSSFLEGVTHGDFVEWNAEDSIDGFVYDWEWMGERSELHDLFHFLWFPLIQGEDSPKIADLWEALESSKGRDFLKSYGYSGRQKPLRRGLNYLLRSYCFYSEQCLRNGEGPENYPFIMNLRTLLYEMLDGPRS